MGLYDNQCMLTGVSLLPSDAALVLLEPTGSAFRPIALAVKGCSDRLGSIDGIKEREPNAGLLLKYFQAKLKSGDFKVDEEALRIHDCWPINTLECALWNFERNMSDGRQNHLHDRRVMFSLICLPIWEAIAKAALTSKKSNTALFDELFSSSSIAQEIYDKKITKVASALREMAAVNKFLKSRRLAWEPSVSDGGQHLPDEMQEYLSDARKKFMRSSAILAGLDAYEETLTECLKWF